MAASDHRQRRQQQEIDNSTAKLTAVDERIWKACAGSLVKIPLVNSIAYYFPQGHVEQSSPLIPLSTLSTQVKSQPLIPCRVQDVSFRADEETDEVFASFRLVPVRSGPFRGLEGSRSEDDVEDVEKVLEEVVSFAKVLTPSDANNGGGFSVPRFCADAIFPPLDFEKDPPVQNIQIRDIHGQTFDFRHIYRGTPRRHLLTTGWSKFVNSKKLVAGDSVVFMRDKSDNRLYVGVRRAVKPAVAVNEAVMSAWVPPLGFVRKNSGGGGVGRGKEVVEAAEKGARGGAFEVVYYPKPGVAEFVIAAERVERALRVYWSEGMRVKLATETEDSSRVQWFQGVVVSVLVPESGAFRGSTWRMLEVKWDEPEILKNMNKVNPWQVEHIPPTPPIHATFPPSKKLKYSTNALLFDGDEDFPLPSVGFSSMMGQLSSSYLNHNTFPAGMQGARQSNLLVSSLPNANTNTDDTRQMYSEYYGDRIDSIPQEANDAPIDLNVGKTSSDTPSPDSQNSVQFFGKTDTNQTSCSFAKKAGITSFQLFGKTIHMEQPPPDTEYDVSETEGAGTAMDHQLVDSYKKLHDKLGDQCKISPVVRGFVNG